MGSAASTAPRKPQATPKRAVAKPAKQHAAAPAAPPAAPPGRKILRGVELFSTGTHTDSAGDTSTWTAADIDECVANFKVLAAGDRPPLIPPVGIGHDSAKGIPDAFVGDSKLAIGDVIAVATKKASINGKDETVLTGDLALDDQVYQWATQGNLSRVSAELLDAPPPETESLGAKGKTLRRVALLGMALPALKFLKPITATAATAAAAHAEGRSRRFCFAAKIIPKKFSSHSGGSAMTRQQLLDWLQQNGVDTSTITDAVPDALLQMLYDWGVKAGMPSMNADGQTNAAAVVPPPDAQTLAGAAVARAGAPAALQTGLPTQVTLKFAEYDRTIAALQAQLQQTVAAHSADRQNQNSAARKAMASNIRVFAEQAVKDGRMRRADIDCDPKTGEPLPLTELASLMRAADSPQVHAFAEAGGKTGQRTALEMEMAKISARPARTFAEKVAVGGNGVALTHGAGSTAEKFKAIREAAAARRNGGDTGPPLETRLNMLAPAAMR